MSDSTRRALRSGYQALIAALTIIPLVAVVIQNNLPTDSAPAIAGYVTAIVGGVAVVSKIVNALEDAGVIPSWLKGDATVPVGKHEAPPQVDGTD